MSTQQTREIFPFGLSQEEPRVIFDAITDTPGSERYQIVAELKRFEFFGEPGPEATYTVALATQTDVLQYHEDRIIDKTVRPTIHQGVFDYRDPIMSNSDAAYIATRRKLLQTTGQLKTAEDAKTESRKKAFIEGLIGIVSGGIATVAAETSNEVIHEAQKGILACSLVAFTVSTIATALSIKELRDARRKIQELKPVEKRLTTFLGSISTTGLRLARSNPEE